jgi:hypothetical protein
VVERRLPLPVLKKKGMERAGQMTYKKKYEFVDFKPNQSSISLTELLD